ncbi:MAG: phage protein GemA/Gp16 family protein [Rikenellaceae bacterium]
MKITAKQIAYIHTLASKKLGWSNEEYKEWLMDNYNIDSIKEIEIAVAKRIISDLAYKDASQRVDKITLKQIGYIKYLWLSVDYERGNNGDTLLSTFLKNKFGVHCIEDLSPDQARGAIAAIKQMQRGYKRGTHTSNPFVLDKNGNEAIYVYLADGSKLLLSLQKTSNNTDHGN